MVKIIKDGKDKIFYTKCLHCATEFEYQLDDVQTEKTEGMIFEAKTIKCPSCGENTAATLLTREECERLLSNYPPGIYYSGCAV